MADITSEAKQLWGDLPQEIIQDISVKEHEAQKIIKMNTLTKKAQNRRDLKKKSMNIEDNDSSYTEQVNLGKQKSET